MVRSSVAATAGSAVDNQKIIPQDELNIIMRKLEDLHSKLYTPKSTWTIFVKTVMGKGKRGEAGGVPSFAEAGALWRSMSDAEKKPYEAMRADDKASADAARDKYNEYMQTVGPRLFDHDEEMEKIEIKRSKEEQQKRFDEQKLRDQRDKADRKSERKAALRMRAPKRKVPPAAEPVTRRHHQDMSAVMTQVSEDDDYVPRSARVAATPRAAKAQAPPRRPGNTKEDLMNGLDPNIWEIRESRHKPGVHYYFNKMDRISVAVTDKSGPQQDAKSQILETHRQLKQQGSRAPATPPSHTPATPAYTKQAPASNARTKQTGAPKTAQSGKVDAPSMNKRLSSKQPGAQSSGKIPRTR